MKKAFAGLTIAIAAVAVPVWHKATSSLQITGSMQVPAPDAEVKPTGRPPSRPNSRQRQTFEKQSDHAAKGIALTRIEDPSERDAALAEWVSGFATNDEIVSLIAALRADPHSTASLRALIAPHLTRQWATVDGPACIAAYLTQGALYRRDPLDSNNNPFAALDSDTNTKAAGLFTIIAETNPTAFDAWRKSSPADLIQSLLGDFSSATWQKWSATDRTGGKTIRDIDPVLAQDFHKSDFANLLATCDPELLLRPALDGRDLGLNRRYYAGLLTALADNDAFAAALLKTNTPGQLWEVFEKVGNLGPELDENSRTAFLKLAQLEIAANTDTLQGQASAAAELPADHRQAATFTALLDSLDPDAGETYWAGINTIAKAINDTAPKTDAATELALINSYSQLRGRIATALAKENIEAAIIWAGSIRDQRNRASCLMQIAAQELKPSVIAWASGELGVEEVDEQITLHLQDGSSSHSQVKEFTLPAVAGETLPQYYVRLRAALKDQLDQGAAINDP